MHLSSNQPVDKWISVTQSTNHLLNHSNYASANQSNKCPAMNLLINRLANQPNKCPGNQSINVSINIWIINVITISIYQSICQYINISIKISIYRYTNQISIHQYINRSIYQPIRQLLINYTHPANQSINNQPNQSTSCNRPCWIPPPGGGVTRINQAINESIIQRAETPPPVILLSRSCGFPAPGRGATRDSGIRGGWGWQPRLRARATEGYGRRRLHVCLRLR